MAGRYLNRAQAAFARGDLDAAETLAMRAICARTDWEPAFRMLGRICDAHDEPDIRMHAQSCYRRELPAIFLVRQSKVSDQCIAPVAVGEDKSDKRFIRTKVDASQTTAIVPPTTLRGTSPFAYDKPTLYPAATFVDEVPAGKLWYDSWNSCLFDRYGVLLDDHANGSVGLVESLAVRHTALHLGPRVFVLGARACSNYYHWMIDVLPRLALCQAAGFEFRHDDRFVVPRLNTSFHAETLAAFGISDKQLFFVNHCTPWVTADLIIAPHLKNHMALEMGSWVPAFLRDTFVGNQPRSCAPHSSCDSLNTACRLANENTGASGKLFISRDPARSNGRGIANLSQTTELLHEAGFQCIYPERLSVAEQARLFNQASVVVAAHGAGLTNIVFCQPGTTVVELYGEHLAPCFWAISALGKLHYINHDCRTLNESASRENITSPSPSVRQKHSDARTRAQRRSASFSVQAEHMTALLELVAAKGVAA